MHRVPDPLRILLVDDEPQRRCRLACVLRTKSPGPIAITTADSHRAIVPSLKPSFDVAILAISEARDPLASVKQLSAHLPEVPIVTVDGNLEETDMRTLLEHGVQDHLPLRCTSCPGSPRLMSALQWARERQRLLNRIAAMRKESEHQALHDHLTGLPNRQLFRDRLKHLLSQAKRRERLLALLFIDLDRFKSINDSLGHDAGDQLLVEVADRLRSCVRASDTCARWGGDEFTLALDDVRRSEDVERIARKINRAVAAPLRIDGKPLNCSASIGISMYPRDGEDEETLMRKADLAMYQSKSDGAGGHRFYIKGARPSVGGPNAAT